MIKKLCLFLLLSVFSRDLFAQAPHKMTYQAVVRDSSYNPVTNSAVGMQISILQSSPSGTAVYIETQTPVTNAFGLITIEIGGGAVVSGNFANINWANGPFFLKTETDPAGGTNYSITGTTQLLSVPYALFSGNGVPGGGISGQILTNCNGVPVWTTGGQCPPSISALNCATAVNSGTLTQGIAASGVSTSVPYTGGNGGTYNAQTVNSTGVTGLTATLAAGTFANGSGNLTYTISGTPASAGTASFALSIGGQSCILTGIVSPPAPSYPSGTVYCGGTPTAVVDVTNPATGKTWMDRNLGATQLATSSIDTASYGDLYQWGRGSDGHQCRTSLTTAISSISDQPGHGDFIFGSFGSLFDWRIPQNTDLWQGINGVNNPCPSGYRLPTVIELNAERLSWSSNTAAGAFASPLQLPMPGYRYYSSGSLNGVGISGEYWSSSVSGINSLSLGFYSGNASISTGGNRSFGFSVRCLKETPPSVGTIDTLDCNGATNTGTLTQGIAASGLSTSVPYTGGNGGTYNAQTVNSTGVTGLTATIAAGTFANGSGNLTYTISGTPVAAGTASFALSIGGQTCTLSLTVAAPPSYPVGTVHCGGTPTAVVDVINPATGKIWMDRNLGAAQAATSSSDAASYGDLYQWGRRADGHQCRTSTTTTTLSSSDQPSHGFFITVNSGNYDWRSPENNNLWQGVSGVNNPCPSGYRLPTDFELNAEFLSWAPQGSNGAFASPLKLPLVGYRDIGNGALFNVDNEGTYWSSTISNVESHCLIFQSFFAAMGTSYRAYGISVRCIKD